MDKNDKNEITTLIICCTISLFITIWIAALCIEQDIKKLREQIKINTNDISCFVNTTNMSEKIKNIEEEIIEEFVTLTVYNPIVSQCNNNPLITANGTKIDLDQLKSGVLKYCAVSRDLLNKFPYGSIIYIEGFGEYLVVDTMNKRFKKYVDILQDVDEPIFKYTNIKITKIS